MSQREQQLKNQKANLWKRKTLYKAGDYTPVGDQILLAAVPAVGLVGSQRISADLVGVEGTSALAAAVGEWCPAERTWSWNAR